MLFYSPVNQFKRLLSRCEGFVLLKDYISRLRGGAVPFLPLDWYQIVTERSL